MGSASKAGQLAVVELRAVRPEDVETFYQNQRDVEANRLVGSVPRSREAFIAHWENTASDPDVRRMSVTLGGRLAGYVGSFVRGRDREVCYWLGRAFWNQGIATRALARFLEGESVCPLWARVSRRNPGSIRVLEKCAFVRDRDDRYVNAAGETIDEFVFRRTS